MSILAQKMWISFFSDGDIKGKLTKAVEAFLDKTIIPSRKFTKIYIGDDI